MGGAAPENFVRDKDELRHGTHDRIWKPKTVYVDTDGSLLIPVIDKLVAVGRESIDSIIAEYPDKWRNKLEFDRNQRSMGIRPTPATFPSVCHARARFGRMIWVEFVVSGAMLPP